MKLLADENIPSSVVRVLKEDGYDIRGDTDRITGYF